MQQTRPFCRVFYVENEFFSKKKKQQVLEEEERIFFFSDENDDDDDDDSTTRWKTKTVNEFRPTGPTKRVDVSSAAKRRRNGKPDKILANERGERPRDAETLNRVRRRGVGGDAVGG